LGSLAVAEILNWSVMILLFTSLTPVDMLLPLFLKLRLLILDLINVIKIDLSKVSTDDP